MRAAHVNLVNQFEDNYSKCCFRVPPLVHENDGTIVSGATGAVNNMAIAGTAFEYHIKGAGQTITTPVIAAGGLDVSLDQTDDEGLEITQGITARNPTAFTVGTDAFYAKCKFSIADVSGTDDCAFGFRKTAAYTAAIDDYTDFAVLNVISGDITIETALNNAATTTTDTTNNSADGETHTLEVWVTSAGVVTYKIDGAAPTTVAAFTFDSGDVVIPFFYFLHAADVAGAVLLQEWEAGLQ